MDSKDPTDSVFFDEFRLERTGLLRLDPGGYKPVALGSRALDLLWVLAQRAGEIASKDMILRAVWADAIVEDVNLTVQISGLRRVIDRWRPHGSYIQTVPRRGYRFVAKVTRTQTADGTAEPGLADKPSLAVMPFQNLSGDPAQEYFADGMAEEIITAIARVPWLFVSARNSSFTYKGRAVHVKQAARELGVRYVLDGSVRKAGDRVRITGQLSDASTGGCIWTDRFDGTLGDVFDLQDKMASSVVGAIEPKLRQSEIDRAVSKPTVDLDAYDLYLRALGEYHKVSLAGWATALSLSRQALAIDSLYLPAAAMVARVLVDRHSNGVAVSADEVDEALRLARFVVQSGSSDPDDLSRSAFALSWFAGEHAMAVNAVERATTLNPNSGNAWGFSAMVHVLAYHPEAAIAAAERAMWLSPHHQLSTGAKNTLAYALMIAGRHEEAMEWVDQVLHQWPNHHIVVRLKTALCGHLGRPEAGAWVARLRELNPAMTIAAYQSMARNFAPGTLAITVAGLRRAGLPEE
jgi:TolB-like protein